MKTRAIIIMGISVLALAGLGVATITTDHSRVKTPTAGRRSTISPAKGFAPGETAASGLPVAGARRRDGGAGGPVGRNQVLPSRGKSGGSDQAGDTGSRDHVPLDAESTMADASAGTILSRTNHHRTPGNNQISQTRFPPLNEQFSKNYAPFFEKNSLSESLGELIVNNMLGRIERRVELQRQGMSYEEIRETMSEYRKLRDEELRGALGDELYQSWSDYHYNIFNHQLVNDLNQRFEGTALGITWEQREKLVSIFADTRVAYSNESGREISNTRRTSTIFTFTRAQEQVMQEAANVFNQQQMETLKQFWSEITNLPR